MIVTKPIRITVHWFVKAQGWAALLFFAFLATYSGLQGHGQLAIFFLCVAMLGGLLLILARSSLEADAETITVNVPYGRYQIRWDEIKLIETNHQGNMLVFHGDNKRLVISTMRAGKGTQEWYELMNAQIQQRHFEVKRSITVPLTHKNARLH